MTLEGLQSTLYILSHTKTPGKLVIMPILQMRELRLRREMTCLQLVLKAEFELGSP